MEEDGWVILSNDATTTLVLIVVCKCHRTSLICTICGAMPESIKKKLIILRKIMSYPG